MKQYYIYDNNQQHGPYTMDQLRAMPLRPDMLMWYEGLAQWTRCDQVQELQGIFPPAPPTMSVQPAPPPMVQPQMAIPVMQIYPPPVKKKSVVGKVLATIVVLVVVVSMGALYMDSISSASSYGSGSSPQQTGKDLEAANPFDYLEVGATWEYDFLTKRRILADVTVINNATETAYSGIVIKVQQYSDSDILLGESEHRLSSIIYPGTSKSNRIKVNVDRSAKQFNFMVMNADAYE